MAVTEAILELDQAERWDELGALIEAHPEQLNDVIFACLRLLKSKRLEGAWEIARQVRGRAFNPALGLAEALRGIKTSNIELLEEGRAHLKATVDRMPVDLQRRLYGELEPLMYTVTGNAFMNPNGHSTVMALMHVLTALTPPLRPVFDVMAPAIPFDLEAARRDGASRSRLVSLPALTVQPKPRRAVVALRARFFPQDPASRPFEIGWLIAQAMASVGWTTVNHGMEWDRRLVQDIPRLIAACRAHRPDVLVMDEQIVGLEPILRDRAALIAELRREFPGLQVVGLHLDPWSISPKLLAESAADVDVVWSFAPDLPAWSHPAFSGKMFFAPLPYPVILSSAEPIAPRLTFHGSILTYNWLRWMWLAALKSIAAPVSVGIANHKTDGQPTAQSFGAYLLALQRAGAILNFGMRSDLSVATTGRTFETLAAGALLIQESTPELGRYLVAGEHYLPFNTLPELRGIVEFLRHQPNAARTIRDQGAAFFRERYAPEKIIASLDAALKPACR